MVPYAPPPRACRTGRRATRALVGLAAVGWAFARPAMAAPPASDDALVVQDKGTDPRGLPGTVSVVPIDERLGAGADLGQAVSRAPGVRVSQLGALGDFSAVSVRGSSLRQVVVAIDGVPLNPDGAAVVNLSELPMHAFSAVEVWRGAAPARFGVAPIGGIINLVTGDRNDSAQAALVGGSLRTGRAWASLARSGTLGGRAADVLTFGQVFSTAGTFWTFSDNNTPYTLLDDRRFRRDNNDKSQLSAAVRARWGSPRLRLSVHDHVLLRDEGIPGPVAAPSAEARLRTQRNLAVVSAEGAGGGLLWTARTWRIDRAEDLADPADELGVGTGGAQTHTASAGVLAHGQLHLHPNARPALTLSVRRDQAQAGAPDSLPDPQVRWAGTASGELDLGRATGPWSARLGAQLDAVGATEAPEATRPTALPPPSSEARTAVSPRAGVALRPLPLLRLGANVQRAFRVPDMTELVGDRGALVGNPSLRPEQGLQWDVGGRVASEGGPQAAGSLELLHFWSWMHDQIIYVQNSQNTAVPINFGETWTQGLELGGGGAWAPWGSIDAGRLVFELRTTGTWTLSRNLSPRPELANKQLPRVPTLQLLHETGAQLGGQLRVGHSYTRVSGNHWDATNLYLSPPRNLHGAFVRWTPPLHGPGARHHRLHLEASGQNLTNAIVQVVPRNRLDPADTAQRVESVVDFAGYPIAGRAVFVGLRWEHAPDAARPAPGG